MEIIYNNITYDLLRNLYNIESFRQTNKQTHTLLNEKLSG